MATTETFNAMIKKYQPYGLIERELKRRNWFWNWMKKKGDHTGGAMDVPFEDSEASSVNFGGLTAVDDIHEGSQVLGSVSAPKEMWLSMKFNEKDLRRHGGDLEKSFLSLYPRKLKQSVERGAERLSISLLGDNCISRITADNASAASGIITVEHPTLFTIGEAVSVDDNNSSPASGFVTAIDMNAKTITVKTARSAGSAVDLSGYTVAQAAKVYAVGQQAGGFESLAGQLLTSGNGGDSTIFGVTKTSAQITQALNISGSGFTTATILKDLFGAFYDYSAVGNGSGEVMLVPFQVMRMAAQALQASTQYKGGESKTGYGYRELNLIGPDADLKLVAVRGMRSDLAYILDKDTFTFHYTKDGLFSRKRFDGNEFYTVRNTTGYVYVVDTLTEGNFVCHRPEGNAVIHSIPTLT